MKSNKLVLIFLLTLWIIPNSQVWAEGKIRNGGDGVLMNGVPYLLDLVEMGAEQNPYFKNPSNFDTQLATNIKDHIQVSAQVSELIAAKIREIEELGLLSYGFVLKQRIMTLDWNIVNRSLKDVKDEDSVFEFGDKELVQLAIRREFQIIVDKSLWDQMTSTNQAALILHEVNYSLLEYFEIQIQQNEAPFRLVQFSWNGRMITGTLFSPSFSTYTIGRLSDLLKRHHIFAPLNVTGYGIYKEGEGARSLDEAGSGPLGNTYTAEWKKVFSYYTELDFPSPYVLKADHWSSAQFLYSFYHYYFFKKDYNVPLGVFGRSKKEETNEDRFEILQDKTKSKSLLFPNLYHWRCSDQSHENVPIVSKEDSSQVDMEEMKEVYQQISSSENVERIKRLQIFTIEYSNHAYTLIPAQQWAGK